jgi:quercetin dioxygenase-like cupin family protein
MKGGTVPVATLTTIDLSSLELVEVWSKTEPTERSRFNFPISGETGATGASVAYAEIEPGGGIPMHHDSANEVDLILEGELEFELDAESRSVGPGVLIQIPAEVSHRVHNRGDQPARLVFFFDSPRDVVVFDEPLMPMDATVL